MKSKSILSTMLILACTFSMHVNAQLEVQTSGNVKASKSLSVGTTPENDIALNVYKVVPYNTTTTYGIKSKVTMPPSYNVNYSLYGIYGSVDGHEATTIQSPQPIIGVYGRARKNENLAMLSAGVAGITNWRSGVGVYGGINEVTSFLPADALYAGYFAGTTKVNGTLFATSISTTSDERQKENIQNIPSSLSGNFNMLRPVSYTLRQDSLWKYDTNAKELQGVHYGLLAQELQKIYPELVYEREGLLSINYIELIPLLIMKVQELSKELEELKQVNAGPIYKQVPAHNTLSKQAVLYQNVPNPFTVDTKIAYHLPKNTRTATLYIYNMSGLQVADYPIMSFGEGAVIVAGGALEAGMYLYSLIADGQIVDTKRMVLKK